MTQPTNSPLPWWRRLRRRLYYWLLVLVLGLASGLSLQAGRWLGRNMARLGSALRPGERQQALSNLALAFPEMDTSSREQLFQRSVVALGENFYDTLATPRLVGRKNFVSAESAQGWPELIEEMKQLSQAGQGVLLLTGHLGCWELLGASTAQHMAEAGLGQLAVVTGSIHNPAVDRLVQRRREKLGMIVLPRHEGAAPILRHLRGGGVVAMLLDQNTRAENLPIPFFGVEAPTPAGFARIALRNKVPILPVVLARSAEGHQMCWSPAWRPGVESDKSATALTELLLWCNQSLENFIRRNPAEWVWFHKRWALEEDSPSSKQSQGTGK